MDYTLTHYHHQQWEERAYEYLKRSLVDRGWPVSSLTFDENLVTRGLVLDLELGNLVKANRFGFIKQATHGTRSLGYTRLREVYAREQIDLSLPRWVFVNTFFGLSEACMYLQVVDLLDTGSIREVIGYEDAYEVVRSSIDEAHMEGSLKAEIINDPKRFVDVDEDLPLALLDLKYAGQKIMLITNSEWSYAKEMLRYCFDPFLPGDMTWRELFDVKIVSASKPDFFSSNASLYRIINEEGHLSPARSLDSHHVYVGGNAALVERHLAIPGERILYVGDHLFADVRVSKRIMRWRTGLVVRELEPELLAIDAFRERQTRLSNMMRKKDRLEDRYSQARLLLQRLENDYGPRVTVSETELRNAMQQLRTELVALDAEIAPLAEHSSKLAHPRWGLLMRTGNDKSLMARHLESYADVYTSRVSNLLHVTPFVYLRSPRGDLPHDRTPSL